MEKLLLKAVTKVVYLGYKQENIIMVEKRSHLLRIVLNYAVRSERDSPRLTFRIAISKQSAMSDTSWLCKACHLSNKGVPRKGAQVPLLPGPSAPVTLPSPYFLLGRRVEWAA